MKKMWKVAYKWRTEDEYNDYIEFGTEAEARTDITMEELVDPTVNYILYHGDECIERTTK